MVDMIVFPSGYFDPKTVDEDMKPEYEAALSTGLFNVAIFSYEKWFDQDRLVVTGAPEREHSAIYRGWMMQPEQYERFYNALLERRIRLVTGPQHYRALHLFPNVYEHIKSDTAKIATFPLHARIDVGSLKRAFARFMVKDYVKSVKGTDFPIYFDRSVTQEAFDQWMEVFYRYRGELLTGGICVKEFLSLRRYGNRTNEYRVFYIDHQAATVWRNSGQSDRAPAPPRELIEKYAGLDSPYYTIDYAEQEDGAWTIIEAGDGGVSGLSDGQDPQTYFRILYQCFK